MGNKNYYIMFYDVVDDYVEKRAPYRKEHIELAMKYVESGDAMLGGAYEDPADGAALVFYSESEKVPEEFAKNDPYVKAGVVKNYQIRKWKVVTGTACENPISPSQL